MTDEELAQRLRERTTCAIEHQNLMVPDNGFGWKGRHCPKCGFRFFGEWEPWVDQWIRG